MSDYYERDQQFEPPRRGPQRQRFENDDYRRIRDDDDDNDQRYERRRSAHSMRRAARSSLDAVTPMATLPAAIGVAAMEAGLRAWREFSDASREAMRAQQEAVFSGLQSATNEGERQYRRSERMMRREPPRGYRQEEDGEMDREEPRFRGQQRPQGGGGQEIYD